MRKYLVENTLLLFRSKFCIFLQTNHTLIQQHLKKVKCELVYEYTTTKFGKSQTIRLKLVS